LFKQAKEQSRKIITERTAEAEEILEEIEEIFKKESISQADLIYARTLKNKLRDKAFDVEQEEIIRPQYKKAKESDMKLGAKVYVTTLSQEGIIQNVRAQKKEVEVLCGNLRVRSKFDDIAIVINAIEDKSLIKTGKNSKQKTKAETVQVKKSLLPKLSPGLEVNVIGYTVADAIIDVGALLDGAVISNLEEVRIIHGMGTGKLRAGIHEYLRTHPNVAAFRLGKYGEGDTGVTIVKIK
jgi:DNA mismatch repair protein MutS2